MRCDCSSNSWIAREVDRLEPPDLLLELGELALPLLGFGFGRARAARISSSSNPASVIAALQRLRAQAMLLFGEPHLGDRLAALVERLLDAMAFLLEAAQLGILFLQRLARFDELPVDEQALVQIGLPLVFETCDRTRCPMRAARRSRLRRVSNCASWPCMRCSDCSSDASAERRDSTDERHLMRALARLARVHARFFARFEQRTAFAVERLPPQLVLAHLRDGGFEPPARLARLFAIAGDLALELVELGRDARHALARAVDAAALALQLAGDLGETPVRGVHLALRIVARLLGFDALTLAGVGGFDVRGDFAFERVGARPSARGSRVRARSRRPCEPAPRSTRAKPAPSHSPAGVTTDSPSPRRAAMRARLVDRSRGAHARKNASRRRRTSCARPACLRRASRAARREPSA